MTSPSSNPLKTPCGRCGTVASGTLRSDRSWPRAGSRPQASDRSGRGEQLRQGSDQGVLIGVCGIDGAGKTTLISALREWAPLSEARVQKLKPGANYQRLMRGIPDPWADLDALFGSQLARSMGWAEVFDFLSYHDHQVRPALRA